MEDIVAPDVKRTVVTSAFIRRNNRVSSNFVIPDGVNPIQWVELMASESGGLVTFEKLVEPNFGDDPDCDNGTGGPRTGPVGEGVLAAAIS